MYQRTRDLLQSLIAKIEAGRPEPVHTLAYNLWIHRRRCLPSPVSLHSWLENVVPLHPGRDAKHPPPPNIHYSPRFAPLVPLPVAICLQQPSPLDREIMFQGYWLFLIGHFMAQRLWSSFIRQRWFAHLWRWPRSVRGHFRPWCCPSGTCTLRRLLILHK